MSRVPFYTVDVFTEQRFSGAQIAVFTDAESLDDDTRQKIAAEMNLSDTVFLEPEQDGYRIASYNAFEQTGFGSHTTVAAACALADAGKLKRTADHVPLNFYYKHGVYSANIGFTPKLFVQMTICTAPIVDNYVPSNSELAAILSLEEKDLSSKKFTPKLVSNEGLFLIVPVNSLEAVRKARFSHERWQSSTAPSTLAQQILLISESTEEPSADFHLRLMGAQISEKEDPPVGSSIPAFAAFLCAHQHLSTGTYCYSVERGIDERRKSILHIEMDHKAKETLNLRIGGNGVVMSSGELRLGQLKAV